MKVNRKRKRHYSASARQINIKDEKIEFLASDLESVKEESKRYDESQNNESESSSCNLNMSCEFIECLDNLFSPKHKASTRNRKRSRQNPH